MITLLLHCDSSVLSFPFPQHSNGQVNLADGNGWRMAGTWESGGGGGYLSTSSLDQICLGVGGA